MNRTSRSSSEVRIAARSPARSMAGPEVYRTLTPSSRAMIVARVVLPRPGGPYRRTWSAASPLPRAAVSSTDRFALTSRWPMYSSSVRGRRVPSMMRSPSASGSADRMRERSSVTRGVYHATRRVSHGCSHRLGRKSHYRSRDSGVGCRDATVPPLGVRPSRARRPRPARGRGPDPPRDPGRTQPPAGQVPRADHGHAQARRDRPDDARGARRLRDRRRPGDGLARPGHPAAGRRPGPARLRLAALLRAVFVPGRGDLLRCATR